MLIILGYFLTFFVGVSLSMFGSGGSLLALPIFIYFFSLPPLLAATYSLATVFVGAVLSFLFKRKKVSLSLWESSFFAIPSLIGVFITKIYLIKLLPEEVNLAGIILSQQEYLITSFAGIGLLAGYSMLIKKENKVRRKSRTPLALYGFFTGTLTGLFGSGGGFIIVPILRRYGGLTLQESVVTSLLIVTLNSFFGLTASLTSSPIKNEYSLLILSSLCVAGGVFIGRTFDTFFEEKTKEIILGSLIIFISVLLVFVQYQ